MRIEANELVGEVLTHIDEGGDTVKLTTQSGREIYLQHSQNCCESVYIVDTQGDWHELIGKPLMIVEKEENGDIDDVPASEKENYLDSFTNTIFTFQVNGATVINRWIGKSNGYYSERVDIEDITKKHSWET